MEPSPPSPGIDWPSPVLIGKRNFPELSLISFSCWSNHCSHSFGSTEVLGMGVRDGDFVDGGRDSGVEREVRDEEEVNDEPCDNEDDMDDSNFGREEKFSGGVDGMVFFRLRFLGGESGGVCLDDGRSGVICKSSFWSGEQECCELSSS